MADENGPAVDLLGDPWTELKDPRGRKNHQRSDQVAEKVAVLRAGGATQEEIAARVRLDEKTLRKYYSVELDRGPKMARAVLLEGMWAKARAGNVSAANFVMAEFEKGDAEPPLPKQPAPPRVEKLGKKAQAEAEALSAHEGTGWGDLLQ